MSNEDEERIRLIKNERIKLRCNYLNGLAIGAGVTGCLATILALYGPFRDVPVAMVMLNIVMMGGLSVALHAAATQGLDGLY